MTSEDKDDEEDRVAALAKADNGIEASGGEKTSADAPLPIAKAAEDEADRDSVGRLALAFALARGICDSPVPAAADADADADAVEARDTASDMADSAAAVSSETNVDRAPLEDDDDDDGGVVPLAPLEACGAGRVPSSASGGAACASSV